jgi:ATP-dependent protease HslVU (ClpYQ) ATPase subunit
MYSSYNSAEGLGATEPSKVETTAPREIPDDGRDVGAEIARAEQSIAAQIQRIGARTELSTAQKLAAAERLTDSLMLQKQQYAALSTQRAGNAATSLEQSSKEVDAYLRRFDFKGSPA